MVTKRQSIFENPSAHRTVDRLVHEVDPHHVPETVDKLVSKITLKTVLKGGSPGLVVMGVDSCSRGRGFESRRHTLDGHDIFHIDVL